MNTGELLQRVRGRLDDAVGESRSTYWSDHELINDYADEARTRMFRRTRWLILDSSTATDADTIPLCSIPIVALTAPYTISNKILSIECLVLSTGTLPLLAKTRDQLYGINPKWQTETGEPRAYCTDLNEDSITLYPIPIANATASLTVYRRPLVTLNYATPTAPLGFPEEFHDDLIPGIMELALQKWDSESQNAPLSLAYGQKFDTRCEDIKDELLRRKPRHNTNSLYRAYISG